VVDAVDEEERILDRELRYRPVLVGDGERGDEVVVRRPEAGIVTWKVPREAGQDGGPGDELAGIERLGGQAHLGRKGERAVGGVTVTY